MQVCIRHGLVAGLVLVVAAVFFLAFGGSPRARTPQSEQEQPEPGAEAAKRRATEIEGEQGCNGPAFKTCRQTAAKNRKDCCRKESTCQASAQAKCQKEFFEANTDCLRANCKNLIDKPAGKKRLELNKCLADCQDAKVACIDKSGCKDQEIKECSKTAKQCAKGCRANLGKNNS